MSKNGRWISAEIKHLIGWMGMLGIDLRSGNLKSALTNYAMSMGIIKGMKKRDKASIRDIEKIGKTIGILRKYLRPLMKEVAKETLKAYVKEKARR